MTGRLRILGTPAAALALVGAVLAVQLANGGGRFEPLQPADPCAARSVTSRSSGLDGLTERLVLTGLDEAACRLGVSREALTLELARPGDRSDAEIRALHDGLLAAVHRMDDEGSLPPVSDLSDEALDSADLNGLLEAALRAIPDPVVDAALATDDLLVRAIDDLDLRAALADLERPDALDDQVATAVTRAVRESLVGRVRGLL